MAQIQLYNQTQLPPREVGLTKPSMALADRSGQQQLGQTIANLGEKVWGNVIQARVNNEIAIFQGAERLARENLREKMLADPFASPDDMDKWRKETISEIENAGQVSKLPAVNDYAKNWMAQNKEPLSKNISNDMAEIMKQHQQRLFNVQVDNYLNRTDAKSMEEGKAYIESQNNILYPKEIGDARIEGFVLKKTAQFEKIKADQVKTCIETQAFAIAEEQGYGVAEEFLRSPDTRKQLLESGMSREDAKSLITDINENVKHNKVLSDEKLEAQREIDRGNINDAIYTGQVKLPDGTISTDIRAYIESTSLDEDEQEAKWQQAIKENDRKLDGADIMTDSKGRADFYKEIPLMLSGAVSRDELLERVHNARFGDYSDKDEPVEPTLNEKDYKSLITAINAQYEQGYGQQMSQVNSYAEGILLKADSLGMVENAPVRYKQLGDFQEAWNKWVASKGADLKLSEIYSEGRRLAATFQISNTEAGRREDEFDKELQEKENKPKQQTKKLTPKIARRHLDMTGNDREEAIRLAAEDGYKE